MSDAITTTPETTAQPWYHDLDDETKGYLQNRGLDKLDAPKAAAEILKSFRSAEQKLGIPSDRVLRIPEPDDKDGWKQVHQKLGAPSSPDGYDFSNVKHADGKPAADDFVAFMRAASAQFNVPKEAAAGIAEAFIKYGEGVKANQAVSETAAVAAAHDQLRQNWGGNFETNKFVADRAAALLGIPVEALTALAGQTSYATVMEGLRKVGVSMGEATLIGNAGPNGGNLSRVMTREQAMSRKADLMTDQSWIARWVKGDRAAMDEISNLDRLIVGAR